MWLQNGCEVPFYTALSLATKEDATRRRDEAPEINSTASSPMPNPTSLGIP